MLGGSAPGDARCLENRPAQGVEVQVEPENGRSGLRVDLEVLHIDGVHHELVTVRARSGRRARTHERALARFVGQRERLGG